MTPSTAESRVPERGTTTTEVRALCQSIQLLALDVDGVLTDGRINIDAHGTESRSFHARDGLGMAMAMRAGITLAVVSGRRSKLVETRMQALGVEHVLQGIEDKHAALGALQDQLGLAPESTAAVGDDLIDLALFRRAGFRVAVADAHARVRGRAHYVTLLPGGRGAVREVCDLLLDASGRLEDQLRRYGASGASGGASAGVVRKGS